MRPLTILLIIIFIIMVNYLFIQYISNNKTFINEHMTVNSNEAIQNIASLYNNSNLTVTNLSVTGSLNILPKGCIIAFNRLTAPTGWALCDGLNGTPDLRGKFIFGYDSRDTTNFNGSLGLTGGERTHKLTLNELPSHNHQLFVGKSRGDGEYPASGYADILAGDRGGAYMLNANYISSDPFIQNTGGDQPHNIMPSYYVLAYIIKL